MNRAPWPHRTLLIVAALLTIAGVLQGWALRRAPDLLVLDIALPLVGAFLVLSLLIGLVTRARIGAILEGLEAIARGDFRARLPMPRERAFVVVRDAFARANEELDRLTVRLQSVDAERRRLFADLSHELATPAAAILGISDTVGRADLVPDEEARERLFALLETECLRLTRLVEDVRDLALVEDPDVTMRTETVDLSPLVERVVDRLRTLEPEMRVELRTAPVLAQVDPIRIEQVLVNLLSNARRHGDPTGVVRVQLQALPETARLTVEDAGQGLDDDTLAQLGTRLFRRDPSRSRDTGGLGLGLAIVRSIVVRHGGALAFEHGERGGLRVRVELPI